MRTLLWLTDQILNHCFSPQDVARLQAHQEVAIYPDEPVGPLNWAGVGQGGAEAMVKWYESQAAETEIVVTGWGTPGLTDAMLEKSPNLKCLVHSAGSFHHLLPPSFWSRNILLASCNEPLAIGVAETTVAMMVGGLKRFDACAKLTRQGLWGRNDLAKVSGFPVRELYDITIGLIGASKVGLHVIRLLKSYQVDIIVYDPYLSPERAKELGVEKVELMDLMSRSEIVSLHAPNLPATQNMLRAEHFKAMRDHAIFINTARGAIVNEPEMTAELATGRIGAYLDVTHPEPPAVDHPLRSMPNVIITPHIAGAVANGARRLGRQAIDAAIACKNGQPIPGQVTEAMAAHMA